MENCQIALRQLIGLLNARYSMAHIRIKSLRRVRRPSAPVIFGARLPTLDVYAGRRHEAIYLPPPSVYAFVIVPINLLSFFLMSFRYKYSQVSKLKSSFEHLWLANRLIFRSQSILRFFRYSSVSIQLALLSYFIQSLWEYGQVWSSSSSCKLL